MEAVFEFSHPDHKTVVIFTEQEVRNNLCQDGDFIGTAMAKVAMCKSGIPIEYCGGLIKYMATAGAA